MLKGSKLSRINSFITKLSKERKKGEVCTDWWIGIFYTENPVRFDNIVTTDTL